MRGALNDMAPGVPVHGCFCFIAPAGFLADSGMPFFRTLSIYDYPLFYPRKLVKRLNQPGPLSPDETRGVASELATRFPPAR